MELVNEFASESAAYRFQTIAQPKSIKMALPFLGAKSWKTCEPTTCRGPLPTTSSSIPSRSGRVNVWSSERPDSQAYFGVCPPPRKCFRDGLLRNSLLHKGLVPVGSAQHGDRRIPDIVLGLAWPLRLSCPLTGGLQVVASPLSAMGNQEKRRRPGMAQIEVKPSMPYVTWTCGASRAS